MLGVVLHAPRGHFYSPKAARSRWNSIWKAILALCSSVHRTVRWHTEQWIVHAQYTTENPLIGWFPFLWGTGPSGAPCDRWLSSTWQIAVAWLEHRTVRRQMRTVRWIIANVAREKPESAEFVGHAPDCPVHIGLSGEWHQTVRCCADNTFFFNSSFNSLAFT
jgi:hypothetical protein